MKKIIFVGGGTLGHVYPLIPLLSELSKEFELYFIGTKKGLEKNLVDKIKYFKEKYYIDMQGFRRSISIYNINTLKKLLIANKQTKSVLKNIKPDIVIGMGGYISGVVIRIATKLKIKTILHEQNAVMGLSNKLIEKKVDKVLLSFPIKDKIKNKNVVIVGNPRMSEIYESNKLKQEQSKTIVVVGGSRGSKFINDSFIAAKDEFEKLKYKIILITGNKYYQENIEKIIKVSNYNFEIIGFTDKLIEYLKKASVVVSRSGATTLVEMMALRKVCLLIPSPNVTNNHQEKNADILVNNDCAMKLLEKEITKDRIVEAIKELETNMELRVKFMTNLSKISNFKARESFIKEIKNLI